MIILKEGDVVSNLATELDVARGFYFIWGSQHLGSVLCANGRGDFAEDNLVASNKMDT
jgi:hypothetical protein